MEFATELSEQKSREILSSIHHDQGDISSLRKEYIDAIIAYNKSLCYSLDKEKIISIKKRRIEKKYLAKSSMESQFDEFNPLNLLKLSYEANPSLPFLADCVEIVKNKDGTKVLTAKIPLNVGDVIAVESSFCGGLGYDSRYEICSNCMKKAPFTLIPCDNCTNAMFCSIECKITATEGFHSYECNVDDICTDRSQISNRHKIALKSLFKALSMFGGSVKLFHEFLCSKSGGTLFDFDFSEMYSTEITALDSYQLFAASLTKGTIKFSYPEYQKLQLYFRDVLTMYPKMKDIIAFKHFNSIVDFLIKQYQSVMSVDIKTPQRQIWYGGVYVLRPYLHHSCTSNIITPIMFGKLVFIVQQPIKKGSLLTVNHALEFYDYTRDHRQQTTNINCNYICCCVACVDDFPLWKDLNIFENIDLTHDSLNLFKFSDNVSALFKQFKKNCCYIQCNYINYPNSEIVYLLNINKEILKKINFLHNK